MTNEAKRQLHHRIDTGICEPGIQQAAVFIPEAVVQDEVQQDEDGAPDQRDRLEVKSMGAVG